VDTLAADALQLLWSFLLVAVPVVLAIGIAVLRLRRRSHALLTLAVADVAALPGVVVFSAFAVMVLLQSIMAIVVGSLGVTDATASLWITLLTALVMAVVVVAFNCQYHGRLLQLPRSRRGALHDFTLALVAWFVFTPIVMGIQLILTLLFTWQSWPITEHPLSKLGIGGDGYGGVLLTACGCLAAPFLEEFLFRGVLFPWQRERQAHCWLIVVLACGLAYVSSGMQQPANAVAPLTFQVCLALLLLAVSRLSVAKSWWPAGVANAALFAAMHTAVWPTPIPLFLLGLGLAWLAVRAGSWLPCFVVHALFNGVSTVFLALRG
jgi:membrane protease YdiL (CAAX protease family)